MHDLEQHLVGGLGFGVGVLGFGFRVGVLGFGFCVSGWRLGRERLEFGCAA